MIPCYDGQCFPTKDRHPGQQFNTKFAKEHKDHEGVFTRRALSPRPKVQNKSPWRPSRSFATFVSNPSLPQAPSGIGDRAQSPVPDPVHLPCASEH
jgi:hypothetical protein